MPFLLAIRHGRTVANVDKSKYGEYPYPDVPLDQVGIEQAKDAGRRASEFLVNLEQNENNAIALYTEGEIPRLRQRHAAVYYSPYSRARDTAVHVIEALGNRVIFSQQDILLREQCWGELKGKTEDDSEKTHPEFFARLQHNSQPGHRFYLPYPNGESRAHVVERIHHFANTMRNDGLEHIMRYV